jgi:hypothetical protein
MLPKLTRRAVASWLSGAMLCLATAAHAQTLAAVPQPMPGAASAAERAYLENLGRLLEARLAGKSVGYAVVAMLPSGASVARSGGDARRAPDPFPRAMSVDDKITIASVSKTMTATAAMKLLARRNLSVDTPVWSGGTSRPSRSASCCRIVQAFAAMFARPIRVCAIASRRAWIRPTRPSRNTTT